MNEIKKKLIKLINDQNGIFLDHFLDICLFDKNGYYKKNQPIGKNGDFITAPEISQLYGEIIGLYIYDYWKKYLNCKFNLVELGPGKGTLISDIIRINKNFTKFIGSINIYLIEINNKLIHLQKTNLDKFTIKNVKWLNKLNSIEKKPTIIIANEFFDCFSIKQYIKNKKIWSEKKVFFNKKENKFYTKNIVIKNQLTKNNLNNFSKKNQITENSIIELSQSRKKYFNAICNILKKNFGLAIVIDYGYYIPINYSSLQSIHAHKKTNILDFPGDQDISSLVNFKEFEQIVVKNKLKVIELTTQRDFLLKHGIKIRKEKILSIASEKEKNFINKGFQSLVSSKKMGSIFKFLIFSN